MTKALLDRLLADVSDDRPFAILRRNNSENNLEIVSGEISQFETINMIPLPEIRNNCQSVLEMLPFCQIKEREFCCIDDKMPLLVMKIDERETILMNDFIEMIPDEQVNISEGVFDIGDDVYANMVQNIIKDEIGYGAGSNFVLKRKFNVDISEYSVRKALTIFQRLIQNEVGAYWTFLIHTGKDTFIGASPELHIKLENGRATMNPISGTYRYPPTGPTLEGLMDFLCTSKEIDELYMVVEEELKMIGRLCPDGGKVLGPFLKEMSHLAHTEYLIQGQTSIDPREILRETMFSPAVTGSPIENACRVIAKYEPAGRLYYGGVAAYLVQDVMGGYALDSTILIRTAHIDDKGHVHISVGATITRHSDPVVEAAETRAKAKALLSAMQSTKEYNIV